MKHLVFLYISGYIAEMLITFWTVQMVIDHNYWSRPRITLNLLGLYIV